MLSLKAFVAAFVLGLVPVLAVAAEPPAALTDAQKAAVEDVVRNLLTKKEPGLVIQAAQEMQKRQEKDNAVKSEESISANRDKLFNDPNSPVSGNPKGDVTVVQFFDYNCGYCKTSLSAVHKLLAEDKNVKFVYKEFPILGDESIKASKAALASARQGKYVKFYDAMMSAKERVSDDLIAKIAKSIGLNADKLKKDMDDPAIEDMLKNNQTLGIDIGAHGTPAYVINDQLLPGAASYEVLKQAVDEARKKAKK